MEELKDNKPVTPIAPEGETVVAEVGKSTPPAGNRYRKHLEVYFGGQVPEGVDDETALENALVDLLDYRTKGRQANALLIEVFEAHPDVAGFMGDIIKGSSIPLALARNFDLDTLTPDEEDPDYGKWADQATKRKEALAQLTANKVESSKAFDDFEKLKGFTPEQTEAFIGVVDNFLTDIYSGKVTPDFLEAMYKAVNYETTVNEAASAAALQAKNEKIALEKKRYDAPSGDGLPDLSSTRGAVETEVAPKPRFLQSLDAIEQREKTRI